MQEPGGDKPGGLIGLFVRHPTAANLLMALMIIGGLFALDRMNTQFFPDFGIDVVAVSVEWPGASAEDVDANIVDLGYVYDVRYRSGVGHVVVTMPHRGRPVHEFLVTQGGGRVNDVSCGTRA